jgi:hypothetical protein
VKPWWQDRAPASVSLVSPEEHSDDRHLRISLSPEFMSVTAIRDVVLCRLGGRSWRVALTVWIGLE